AFTIETPYYRSATAYIIYLFFLLGISVLGLFYLKKRFEYIRSSEKQKHTAAFQKKEEILLEEQMRAEREIEQLRIDKLESSMRYKNKELANSTYHIIRKNKFLNSLKQEISKLSKAAKSEFVEAELKKISRKIDRDINNEKNWEVFDRYFDEVHQEFLERLKDKHEGLSPKELRLSAYLRMNISTKEIAPLMNISVRGVEISRYRLRKKLELGRNDNLTQYLMNI
ncbi:MAG: transcriptional regulator, partial [Bacteroidales bacterium]|nr:transcriptional regulator [Bacteroidales bacterium]